MLCTIPAVLSEFLQMLLGV